MNKHLFGRRDFLKQMTALGAVGAASFGPQSLYGATGSTKPTRIAYDPAAQFELNVSEVEFRRASSGRMLLARIYQPIGAGPFPTLLDLHGGAWNFKDRHAEEPMDRAIAASGVLVVAIDMTLAPEAPYPACIQDANYGVRWLKSNASRWQGDAAKIGVYGSSSGGYTAELLAMRPRDPRYNAIPLAEAPKLDATIAYAAMRAPISNTFARFENAKEKPNQTMAMYNKTFFDPWEAIHESSPQEILERHEKVTLPPLLIMQGALDDNILPDVQEKFVATYRKAGGRCDFHLFENCVHQWTANEGPQTDKARATVKSFIASQLKT